MSAFELTVTVPADARFGDTVSAVAAEAARQSGCPDTRSARFATEVGHALTECLHKIPRGRSDIEVVYRRHGGELQVVINCGAGVKVARTLRLGV